MSAMVGRMRDPRNGGEHVRLECLDGDGRIAFHGLAEEASAGARPPKSCAHNLSAEEKIVETAA